MEVALESSANTRISQIAMEVDLCSANPTNVRITQIAMEVILCTGASLISIACPVAPTTATVGVFYQSNPPIVLADNPPDTFVLLSGPLWMTINSLTGAVSGIPTATGTVTYTIQVTDSLGFTATVVAPCPLSVSAGPPVCVQVPATGPETLVLYNEPLEQQGT